MRERDAGDGAPPGRVAPLLLVDPRPWRGGWDEQTWDELSDVAAEEARRQGWRVEVCGRAADMLAGVAWGQEGGSDARSETDAREASAPAAAACL